MTKTFKIGSRTIGRGHAPYVIAEMSGNHNGDVNRAMDLIRAAKQAGAHAVKLQTYTADTMTIDHEGTGFTIEGGLWDGRSLYELYEEAHTPWDWHQSLFDLGREIGIDVFSSPFDETAVDFLEQFDPPVYKVASFELLDIPLLEKIAVTGRPIIVSTGMATLEEVNEALSTLERAGAKDLVVLHCVSGYPTPIGEVNLLTIPDLEEKLGLPVGLSDHTLGTSVAVGAVALGACVVEKHFTLRRKDGGPDAAFSLEPHEFTNLVSDTAAVFSALGSAGYQKKTSEEQSIQFRRSIYVVADIDKGEMLTEAKIRRIRPGFGLAPRHYREMLGRKASRKLTRGEPLSLSDVE